MGPNIAPTPAADSGEIGSFAREMAGMPPFPDAITQSTVNNGEQPPDGEQTTEGLQPSAEVEPQSSAEAEIGTRAPASEEKPNTPEPLKSPQPLEPSKASQAPEPAESINTSESANTAETADFSPEELTDISNYADQLEQSAEKDQKMADLLHQFVDIASKQHTGAHQKAPSPTDTSATPSPAPSAQSAPTTPPPTSVQSAPNTPPSPSDAIAAALAEAANAPIPGQTPITTPGEMPVA